MSVPVRHLIVVLGDQLDQNSPVLQGFDPEQDVAFMAEVSGESTRVWSSKPRTAFFLSAMRHFAADLRESGCRLDYQQLGTHPHDSFGEALAAAIHRHQPKLVMMLEAGEWGIGREIREACEKAGVMLDVRDDPHFLITRDEFAEWASGYKQLRMEFFYRMMRKRHDVLMEGDQPVAGRWNFDTENRGSFGKSGPSALPAREGIPPDPITREVRDDVERYFAGHPGSLAKFAWPVTRRDALLALQSFIADSLPHFGAYEDAMWTGQP